MWSSWLAPSVAEWTISVAWLYFSILHALRLDATRTFNLVWQRRATARDGQGGLVPVGDILYTCRESFGGTRGLGYRRDAETLGGAALLPSLHECRRPSRITNSDGQTTPAWNAFGVFDHCLRFA